MPLIQTKRSDLELRPENIYALSLAGLQNGIPELLCVDEVPWTGVFPSNTFALVDHNRLLPQYDANNPDTQVVAVVDHHEDEGFYKGSAKPRIVDPAGSSASHLAHLCPPQIPAELAALLLSAICIDTQGLKDGGKALSVDREAATFLLANSLPSSPISSTNYLQSSQNAAGNIADIEFVRNLTTELSEKKFSVSHFSTRDLLRRDYKQYRLSLPWVHSRATIDAGLSTVPVDLKLWIRRDPKGFWFGIKQWMEERELCILGILTSFRSETKIGQSGRGKHKRQMLWVVREGAETAESLELMEDGPSKSTGEFNRVDVDRLASKLWDGLQDSEVLRLEKRNFEKFGTSEKDADASMRVRVYKQGNVDATRKATAPLMKSILEESSNAETK